MNVASPTPNTPPADLEELAGRARRAYELGRLRAAGRVLWWLAPVVLAAALIGRRVELCSCIGGLLVLATVFSRWRGRALGDAVTHGVVVGAFVTVVGLGMHAVLQECVDEAIGSVCGALCALSGAIGGYALFHVGKNQGNGWSLRQWGTAGLAALVTAPLGCTDLSRGQLLAMAGGLITASVGALTVRHFGRHVAH
jgi:hypothetical protein